MATIAGRVFEQRPDVLSGTPRAHAIDRWIYVAMAAWFIVIVFVGFIPDSAMKVAMVEAGKRAPFPPVMHLHAVLMGSFLLLLLTQTILVATGRCELHKRVGVAAFVFVPVLVVVGFILAPTMYHQAWNGAHFGPPAARRALTLLLPHLDNILLLQTRAGILFALFISIALGMRNRDAGVHKRMMFLATAVPLGAAIDRMTWLPTTQPALPLSNDVYILLAVVPMFVWDVVRNRRVHETYLIWLPIYAAASVVVNLLWNTPGWHATARAIMGVA